MFTQGTVAKGRTQTAGKGERDHTHLPKSDSKITVLSKRDKPIIFLLLLSLKSFFAPQTHPLFGSEKYSQ